MMKRLIVGAALAGALATSALATSTITFDPDGAGAGAAIAVDVFDWQPGDVLSDNVSVQGAGGINNPFTVYYQAALGTLLYTDPTGFTRRTTPAGEFTVVAAFQEVGATIANTAQFLLAPVQTNNFFEIYYDPTPDANNLAGTGFNGATGGVKIFGGTISALSGQSSFTLAANPTGAGDVAVVGPYGPFVANNMDRFGSNNYPTVATVVGSGATNLIVTPTFFDTNFFVGANLPQSMIVDLFTNTSLVDPFDQANPSAQFWTGSGFVAPTYAPNLTAFPGATRMNGGPVAVGDTNAYDFQFQGDANTSFSVVPEPGTMVLLGSGLLGLAGLGRRRMKK